MIQSICSIYVISRSCWYVSIDFTDAFDGEPSEESKKELYDEVIGAIWEAHDEEDLLDEISACTGWCIKSIDYRNILSNAIGGWA